MTIMSDAAGIIGNRSPGDYALAPVEHAEQLSTSAPKLAALLTRSVPVELARQYAEADSEASIAERTFKRWIIRANWAVLATAMVSALLMAAALLGGSFGALTQTILIVFALIGVAVGGIASMSLFRVKEGRLLESWMTARARAETKRLSYFNYIVDSSEEGALDPQLDLLKLEYFRRYQLDLQLAYYKTRRSGHRKSAERTLDISAGSVLVAAFASGAAGVLGALHTEWAALGSLAVFGAALQAFAAAREWSFFEPVPERPRRWVYRTVATEGEMWGLRFRFAAPPTAVARFERAGNKLTATGSGTVEISGRRGCRFGVELPFERRLPPSCR